MKRKLTRLKNDIVDRAKIKENYKRFVVRKTFFIILLAIAIFIVAGIAATLGSFPITAKEAYSIMWDTVPKMISHIDVIHAEGFHYFLSEHLVAAEVVIWNMRLPRIITSVLAGIGLGVAGAMMQGILKNPLASPFTLGISAGAGFGAALAIILRMGVLGGRLLIVGNAFLFSLIPTFVIMVLAKYRRATPEMMILAGIALGSIFGAATTFMMFFADEAELRETVFWMVGDVGRASWATLGTMSLLIVICIIPLVRKAWDLNVMVAGDETAKSLGINVERVRLTTMIFASLLTASIISFVGTIGFIGLVAPHIVRMVIGGDNRFVIPASGAFGGAMLLTADTLARTIIAPVILPVGILTAFMGGPLFLFLLLRQKQEYW